MAESDRRDGDTARAQPGSDDDTTVLPDLTPTEHVALAWSAERPELDVELPPPDDDDVAAIPPMPVPMRPQSQARKTGTVLVVFWLLMAAALLYSCTRDSASSNSPLAVTTSTRAPYDGAAYARQVEQAILSALMTADYRQPQAFTDMCDTPVEWACAIAGIESQSPDSVKVTLQPEGLWIAKTRERDWYKFGEQVARAVYNFSEAAGEVAPSGGWRKSVNPPHRVDVYKSNGELAYESPLSFPGR